MIRVNVVVEGQTEEGFVKQVLSPYLFDKNIVITPRIVLRNRSGGSKARGGMYDYARPKWDIQQWMSKEETAYCTTMFDLYALPADFPDMNDIPPGSTPHQRVRHLEQAFSTDLGNPQEFIPYLQLHEFEAILFSDIGILDDTLNIFKSVSKLNELRQIIERFENAELIDDDPTTAPSKRLLHLYPAYDKRFFGELVAEMIGIDNIRSACSHFNHWIEQLEELDPIA